MPDGQVVFEITGDKKPIGKVIDETTSMIQCETKKWDQATAQSSEHMAKSMTDMFSKISIAAAASGVAKVLADWGKAAVSAASDLEEVQNVVDVTFGDGARQIDDWAKRAGSAFGLTETQAKKFTSTLGAMMKSAGMAGPEIVSMSTDMAGLAADMASFYNMDFETAFQKIRSGISGEVEPLKALGINMSTANLEAYALTQGITKAFDKMSQGEQTMLRYQYLMQATADAQGDFARTSDGYANSLRMLETNIESIKTKMGTLLIPVISEAVSGINDLVSSLTEVPERTILDDFADIDFDLQTRLAEINKAATEAQALVGVLATVNAPSSTTGALTTFVSSLASGLDDLGVALDAAKSNDYAGTLDAVATALSAQLGGDPTQWKALLSAVSENLPSASQAAQSDNGAAAAFLDSAGKAASSLGGDYSTLWGNLLNALGSESAVTAIAALADSRNAAVGKTLEDIANGANDLGILTPDKWSDMFTAMSNAGTLKDVFGDQSGTISTRIEALAKSLNENAPSETTKTAWEGLLGALYQNAGALSAWTGESVDATKSWLSGLASAAAELNADDVTGWDALFSVLSDKLGGAKTSLTDNAQGVADGMSKISNYATLTAPKEDVRTAWAGLIDVLTKDASQLSTLTGNTPDELKTWLADVAEGANAIDPNDANAWKTLFDTLAEGIPGLEDSEAGKNFLAALSGMVDTSGVDNISSYLSVLGYDTDEITDKQKMWLDVCRQLVQTIPGLSEVINTETGEINGGVDAIKDYVAEWQSSQEKMLRWKAYYAKAAALEEKRSSEYSYELEMIAAEQKVKRLREIYEAAGGDAAYNNRIVYDARGNGVASPIVTAYNNLAAAERELNQATDEYNKQVNANADAVQYVQDMHDGLIATYGEEEAAAENAADATSNLAISQETASTAISETTSAMQEMLDYLNATKSATESTVSSVVSGFGKIITPAQKARDEMKRLKAEGLSDDEISVKMGDSSVPTAQNMLAGLESQLAYIEQYQNDLALVRARGVSDDLLAALSDGSVESADYLHVLATATEDEIKDINAAWKEVKDGKDTFIDALTAQKLAADETFDAIVAKANEAVTALDMADGTRDAMGLTIQGIADGIASKLPSVQAQVDALNAILSQINGFSGVSFQTGGVTDFSNILIPGRISKGGKGGFSAVTLDGSHAVGLDYVPFDNYLAALHEGEAILTAEEARVWRNFAYGQRSSANSIDYDALGGLMRDNVRTGGNVYLDGRTVGRVMSAAQADSYRALERSGWQQ